MIVVDNLSFDYPGSGFQLRIQSLAADSGTRVAMVGPSGCGKTTLLHLLAGILPSPAGAVQVDGRDLGSMADAARRRFRIAHIGLVFQDFELVDYLNARENIRLPYYLNDALTWDRSAQQRLTELGERLGVSRLMPQNVASLSQGEKQRVAICRALLPRPKMVLADEPTGNLDPENKLRIMRLLQEQTQQQQATLLVVTHDHNLLNDFDQVWDLGSATTSPANAAARLR